MAAVPPFYVKWTLRKIRIYLSDRPWLNREKERGNLVSLRKKEAEQMKLDMEEPWGDRVKEEGLKREGEVAIERRPNVSGKVLELRCIVGEQTVCLGGLRCGLMPAIGGGLPQLCVSRISDEEREERRGEKMERVQTQNFGER